MTSNLFLQMDFDGAGPGKDHGDRPFTLQDYYTNASIFLAGGLSQTQTAVGRPTRVRVRVSNRGATPIEDVRVEAYVHNAFVGFANPVQALVRLRSGLTVIAPGSGTVADGDAHLVDCFVQGPDGPTPWVPTQAQLDASHGHLCLVANCFTDGEGASIPDGTTYNLSRDAHQGQRNISLIAAAPGTVPVMHFDINPPPDPATPTMLSVEPLSVADIGPDEWWVIASHPEVEAVDPTTWVAATVDVPDLGLGLVTQPDTFPLRWQPDPLETTLTVPGFEQIEFAELVDRDGRDDAIGASRFGRAERGFRMVFFDAPTPGEVTLQPVTGAPGSLQAVDIVQRTEQGEVIGGLRVITLVTA
jgi:hypothetical protein